jgi:AcrR family transcriptional regulator
MSTDTSTGLPTSIEIAWGLREPSGKGPKRALSLPGIVGAAIAIAEREGLAAVSMNRVAARLGASAMSLYRYVGAKEELLALMVDAVYGTPPRQPADTSWRAGLSAWAWEHHRILRCHPWVLDVPSGTPPTTPNRVDWLDAGLACLADTSLHAGQKLSVILLLGSYVRSEATLVAEVNASFRAAGTGSAQAVAAYGRHLSRLIDPRRLPALHAALTAGVFDHHNTPDSEFTFGLTRLLDGVEKLITRQSGG